MAQGIDDLKQKVADVEASEAALKQRVSDLDASQTATAAALQKEIDDLKANPPTGMSDEDAAALAARLQAVVDDMATVDPTAPPVNP